MLRRIGTVSSLRKTARKDVGGLRLLIAASAAELAFRLVLAVRNLNRQGALSGELTRQLLRVPRSLNAWAITVWSREGIRHNSAPK